MTSLDTLKDFKERFSQLSSSLQLESLKESKLKLENELNDPNIWNDPQKASSINQKLSSVTKSINTILNLQDKIENLEISIDIEDRTNIDKLEVEIQTLIEVIENETLFDGPFDSEDCFINIQSGAGGVDAQDWAAMLLSMYQAFAKNQGFDYSTVSLSLNPEGGVKNVTVEIRGIHAFGLLKEEVGVHRLVRLSPFNSGQTRETSFAMVEVLPASVENSDIKVEIDEKDLKWEVSTSQGAGGQSVNTTYSAVKVIHMPTGISVSCQNERSQVQNRAQAMKILKSRLYSFEVQKRNDLKDELRGDFKSPEWGSQIRNYVLHPYKLVKDTRSNWETSNPEDVIEQGNLLPVILSVKKSRKNQND